MTLPRNSTLFALSAALALAATAVAQDEPDEGLARSFSTVRYRGQVDAATRLASQLDPDVADLETIFQISRLLSYPCDQVFWLRGQIESRGQFATDDATRASAEQVLRHLDDLERSQASTLNTCDSQLDALRALLRRIAEPPIPWEIIDPAELATRWPELDPANNLELLRELTPGRKLILAARGLPNSELKLTGAESWEIPARVMSELTASTALPAMPRLLQLDQALSSIESDADVWRNVDFPGPAVVQVTRGLLDRALGLDRNDRPRPTPAVDYAALAQSLETQNLWTWAAAARCLQAAAGQTDAAAQARSQWNNATQVAAPFNAPLWPAFDGAPDAWLNRLQNASNLENDGRLPLSPGYRSDARRARRELEEQFLQAFNNPAEAFRLIQLAKVAGLGHDPAQARVVTPAEIQSMFAFTKRGEVTALNVFALLEMIAVQQSDGRPAYYGVLLNVTGWNWTGLTYDIATVGPFASPAELVRSSFDQRYKELRDLRILIGLDGPLDADWLSFEREQLTPYAGGGITRGDAWLVYLPSLAALQEQTWPLEDTLRYFNQAATNAGLQLGLYTRALSTGLDREAQPQVIADRLDKAPTLPIYAMSFGSFPADLNRARPRGFIRQFNSVKADAPSPAILVFTGPE